MTKQATTKKELKWVKPSIKTISFQQLSSLITASACSRFGAFPCRKNMR